MGNGAATSKPVLHKPTGESQGENGAKESAEHSPARMGNSVAATCDAPSGGQASSSSGGLGASGLAARRAAQGKMAPLKVNVEKMDPRRAVLGQLNRAQDASGAQVKKIEKTDAFDKMYALGSEVMPSVHPGMEIRNAMQLKDAKNVVIKVRKKSNSFGNVQEEKEWRQSAEFMLNLPKSEQITQVYGVWEDSQAYYVVMEKVGGSDLFELLDAEGLLPMNETKAILRQLLKGVQALHEQNCIHKDLKLENVMVCRKGARSSSDEPTVKLIDFDTAQNWEPDSPKSKTVLGTDQYISSEAYAGKYSPASDIFAVGVIAYKLLTGRFPFDSRMFDDEAGENWVGSPKMKQIQDRVQRFHINWNCYPFKTHPEAYELTRAMLAPNDQDRPLADQALKHTFLSAPDSPSYARRRPSSTSLGQSTSNPVSPK